MLACWRFPGESKVVEAVIYIEGEHSLIETGGTPLGGDFRVGLQYETNRNLILPLKLN